MQKIICLQYKNQAEQDLTPARSLVTLCTCQETPGQQSYRVLGWHLCLSQMGLPLQLEVPCGANSCSPAHLTAHTHTRARTSVANSRDDVMHITWPLTQNVFDMVSFTGATELIMKTPTASIQKGDEFHYPSMYFKTSAWFNLCFDCNLTRLIASVLSDYNTYSLRLRASFPSGKKSLIADTMQPWVTGKDN